MTKKKKKEESQVKVYFPGLNGLRFFAAMLVVFGHVELLKEYHGYSNIESNLAVYESGRMGVTFFFVLSGFLISYLLFAEKKTTATISIRKFYIRRVLRIWPLYFLLVILAFFVLPRIPFFDVPKLSADLPVYFRYTLPLFALFLPQLALSIYPPVPFAEPLWSIGVEEQFYLLWPVLVKHIKRFLALAVGIIIAGFLIKQLAFMFASQSRDAEAVKYWNYFINYFYFTRIECMAVGAIGAWLVFKKKRAVLKFIYHPATQLSVYALTICFLVTEAFKPVFNYTIYSVLFCIIILNIATNPRSLIKVESRAFTFLGNISYSIYMLHEIAIKISMGLLTRVYGTTFNDASSNMALYAASIALTLGLAILSYLFYERKFLRLKTAFAIILSGNDVREKQEGLSESTKATLATGF
ncbi:MAG: acyltransferase [Pyrinomonadaceae bacterium]|nr:acyltransferase [Pyrinomonadaceae bacterium]